MKPSNRVPASVHQTVAKDSARRRALDKKVAQACGHSNEQPIVLAVIRGS